MQNTSYNSTKVTRSQVLQVHFVKKVLKSGGYKEMSSIFADQGRPRNTNPNEGGGGGGVACVVSANEYSCAHHVTWSPNKLWRPTSYG
jgi:hypothetical protein